MQLSTAEKIFVTKTHLQINYNRQHDHPDAESQKGETYECETSGQANKTQLALERHRINKPNFRGKSKTSATTGENMPKPAI